MTKRTVVLTGTNRGLGRKTAEILIQKYSEGFTYIFTQRSNNHQALTEAFLKINPKADFEVRELDITNKESRSSFISWFVQKYKTLDVIFNNSGYKDDTDNGERTTKKVAETTFQVNFFATVEFTEELFPYIAEDGKIIEMSSLLGALNNQPEEAQKQLQGNNITKEKLYKLAHEFIDSLDHPSKEIIFSPWVYSTTKAFLNSYVSYVASQYAKPNQSVFAVHPGWVQTDMGGANAHLTVDEACPHLASLVAEIPFGRHPLHSKLIFENKEIEQSNKTQNLLNLNDLINSSK